MPSCTCLGWAFSNFVEKFFPTYVLDCAGWPQVSSCLERFLSDPFMIRLSYVDKRGKPFQFHCSWFCQQTSSSIVSVDLSQCGDSVHSVVQFLVSKYSIPAFPAFQILHRVGVILGSSSSRQVYAHIVLQSIQTAILLQSNSATIALSGVVAVAQQIVSLLEKFTGSPCSGIHSSILRTTLLLTP